LEVGLDVLMECIVISTRHAIRTVYYQARGPMDRSDPLMQCLGCGYWKHQDSYDVYSIVGFREAGRFRQYFAEDQDARIFQRHELAPVRLRKRDPGSFPARSASHIHSLLLRSLLLGVVATLRTVRLV